MEVRKVPDLRDEPFPDFYRPPKEYIIDADVDNANEGEVLIVIGEKSYNLALETIPSVLPDVRRLHRILSNLHTRWVCMQELRALVYD